MQKEHPGVLASQANAVGLNLGEKKHSTKFRTPEKASQHRKRKAAKAARKRNRW